MLTNSKNLQDLRSPPGNRLENLRGARAGQHSIRINEIVLGKRGVTANTAPRLARCFQTSPEFWLGLQSQFDLDVEMDKPGDRLAREVRVRS